MEDPRAILAIVMMATAVAPDMRDRRVPNLHWMPYVAIALLLTAADAMDWEAHLRSWGWAAVMTALAYGLWRLRLFGGADAKAVMVIAWLWPGTPDAFAARIVPAIDVLSNAAILMLAVPFAYAVLNVVRGHVQFPAMFIGTRMDRRTAERRFVWPMEDLVDGRRVWRFRARVDHGDPWPRLRRAGIDPVWVTPKVPFILLLAVGAVVAWTHGNLMLQVLLFARL